jgi:hypothetical protein
MKPGRRQAGQLAAVAQGQIPSDAASLLAGRKQATILDGLWVIPAVVKAQSDEKLLKMRAY